MHTSPAQRIAFALIAVLFLVAGCDSGGANEPDTEEPPPNASEAGALEVTASTSGSGTDEDGYTVALNDTDAEPLEVDGTVTFDDLDPDTYDVALGGLDLGCSVDGDNPRSVEVTAGETATAAFDVVCEPYTGTGTIAFLRATGDGAFEIYAMDADGSNPQRLTDTQMDEAPTLSPDGTRVAFTRTEPMSVNRSVWVMDADGSNATRLTSESSSDRFPTWSPDGTQIAFESDRDGSGFNLYVVNADGSDVTQLTDDPTSDLRPAWSPDGDRIAFTRTAQDIESTLYTVGADGTGLTQLMEASDENGRTPADPSWSPDGSQIAYRGSAPVGVQRVFVADADGSNAQALTPDTFSIEHPSWSPSGDYIAFSTQIGSNHRAIQAVRVSDGAIFSLTDDEDPDSYHPDWSVTAE